MLSSHWTADRLWHVAGWTMLHFLWVGACLGLAAVVLRRLLSAADHHLRYCCALASLAMLAVAPVGIAIGVSLDQQPESPTAEIVSAEPRGDSGTPGIERIAASAPAPSLAPGRPLASSPPEAPAHSRRAAAVAQYLPWVWLLGAPLTFALVGTGIIGAERLRRQSRLPADGELLQQFRRLTASLNVSPRVGIGICDRIASPVVIGIIRPVIMVPAMAATGWSGEQIEMVLLHELAHVRRWDNLVNLLQRLIESLLFFQPAVWVVSHWVRCEREHCCDDFVVRHTGRALAYAETLATIAGVRSPWNAAITPGVAGSFMARNQLVNRIRHIVHPQADQMRVSGKALAGAFSLSALLVCSVIWLGMRPDGVDAADESQKAPALTQEELDAVRLKSARAAIDPAHARVTGVVVDEQGNRLANAVVSSMDWDANIVSTETDAEGVFVLELARPMLGLAIVEARSQTGNLLGVHKFHDQSNSESELAVRIVAREAQRIAVHVADARGAPVPDAVVEAIAWYQSITVEQSDASGTATLLLPQDANVSWIFARKSGLGCDYYENYTGNPFLDTHALPEAVSLTLDGARTVNVRAIASGDKPVKDMQVSAWTIFKPGKKGSINAGGSRSAVVSTDERGVAKFDWLPSAPAAAHATFLPRSLTYRTPRQVSTSESGAAEELTMELVSSTRLSGRVVHLDGRPAAGIMLQAEGRGGSLQLDRAYARTSDNGTYQIDAFPGQTYIIAVLDDKWAAASLTGVEVKGNDPIDGLDLQLVRGTVIRGNVSFPPDTQPELKTVTLIEQAGDGAQNLVQWAYADQDGNYEFRVGPGKYELSVRRASGRSAETQFIKVEDEPEIVVNFGKDGARAEVRRGPMTPEREADAGAYQAARDLAGQTAGSYNLKRIGLAMHGYHDLFGRFPPAVVDGPDGKTKHSWRVELLPMLKHYVDETESEELKANMGREEYNALIKACGYDVAQPWNSEANAAVLKRMPDVYRHTGEPHSSTESAYYVVAGKGTAFEEGQPSSFDDIQGWVASTLMVAESRRHEPWTKPVDLPYSKDADLPEFGGYTGGGALVLTCDGAVHFLKATTPSADVRALITRSQDDTFDIVGIPYRFGQ